MIKVDNKVLIKDDFVILCDSKGVIVSFGDRLEIKMDNSSLITLEKSKISRMFGCLTVSINENFSIERGSGGVITGVLSPTRFLCKFDCSYGPCIIELSKDEILLWSPMDKILKLFDRVRLIEDIPEENLKKGIEGYVVLVYFEPTHAYEVEFFLEEVEFPCYALLPDQIEFVAENLN